MKKFSYILANLGLSLDPPVALTLDPRYGLDDRKRRTKRKTGTVVMAIEMEEVHRVVREKLRGPMCTWKPALSGKKDNYDL